LEPWLTGHKSGANQGLEDPKRMNTPTWENVRAVSVNGETLVAI
jgi:hypothetical protein